MDDIECSKDASRPKCTKLGDRPLRRVLGIFLELVAFLVMLYMLYFHLGIGSPTRRAVEHIGSAVEKTGQKIEVWLDNTPPTSPQSLSAGPAPTIQRVARYHGTDHYPRHIMAPFDSTGGDVIVMCASSHRGVLMTPSDNFNNTRISLTGPADYSGARFNLWTQIWYAKNPKVGPNHVVTITLSAKQSLVISVFVVQGSDISDPIDAVSTFADDADTRTLAPVSPSITTARFNDLLIGFGKSWLSEVWSAGGRYALQQPASSDYLAAESSLAATPGSYNSTFVLSSATNWQAAVVAVRPAEPPSTSQIMLAWQPSSDNVGVIGYQVERCSGTDCEDFAQIGTSKDTSFVDSTPPTPGTYRYRVLAIDAALNVSKYSNVTIAVAPRIDPRHKP